MNLRKRLKQRAVKIKCDREKWKEMLTINRETHSFIRVDWNSIHYCWHIADCYWSKPK